MVSRSILILLLLRTPPTDGILLKVLNGVIMYGNVYRTLFPRTEDECVCQMMITNQTVSALNYISTNRTCQLFDASLTSFSIEIEIGSELIFNNPSTILMRLANSCDGFVRKDNWDLPGNNILSSSVQVPDYTSCCAKCQATVGCTAFAFAPSTMECWPKTSVGTSGSPTSDRISGFPGRSQLTSELQPSVGPWGDFCGYVYCPADTWAYGFQLRVESDQGGADDTALNAVRLFCRGMNSNSSNPISSYDGLWGDWGGAVYCNTTNNDFMYYAVFKIEGSQGSGDDTSANDFRSKCWSNTTSNSSNAYLQATNGGPWGSWMSGTACNQGSAICGINTKFEPYQGSGDDTAMNGAFFACCAL